jgi:hypothetical protein
MPKKTELQLTERHHTSLSDIIDQANTVTLFGKIVKDLKPTTQGHSFAQVFGHKRNNVCSKLASPVVLALPEPDGPADDCGWDPQEFVKWLLPTSFLSTQLHVHPVSLNRALATFPAAGLTAAQLFAIVSASIQAVTGSTQPLNSGQPLQAFGIFSPQQLAQLNASIANNVSQTGFTLGPNALSAISASSTIAQLEQAISDGATPNA